MTETYREWWIERPERPRLHVRSWEPARPRADVAILHGLGDHAGRFERVARGLAPRGFAVHALDLPGHGKSEGPRGHIRSWGEYRESVDALTGRLAGGDGARPLLFLGHSMGALVALDWALVHPERVCALVLSAPPFELAMKPLIFKVWLARIAEKLVPAMTQGNQIPPSLLSRDPEVVRAHRADPLIHHWISARLYMEFVQKQRALARASGALPVPTLVIQGGSDPVASAPAAERWARTAAPGTTTFRLYPGLLHEVLNEPEGPAILEEVGAWCERAVDGAGPARGSGSGRALP
jgi:alpha-beta hydrolase superfamily lysophospholipase